MVSRMVPVESALGFLAFDREVKLDGASLVKVRDALRPIVKKREELQPGEDRDAMMKQVESLNAEMADALKPVLTAEQFKALDAYLTDMQNRSRQWNRN